jgi:hypothetical protein
MIVIAALCTGTLTTLAAQQPTPVVQQPSSPNTALSGPRLQAEWPRYEPRVAENSSSPSALAAAGGSHTIVFSTLALVIIGVIVLVLVL